MIDWKIVQGQVVLVFESQEGESFWGVRVQSLESTKEIEEAFDWALGIVKGSLGLKWVAWGRSQTQSALEATIGTLCKKRGVKVLNSRFRTDTATRPDSVLCVRLHPQDRRVQVERISAKASFES